MRVTRPPKHKTGRNVKEYLLCYLQEQMVNCLERLYDLDEGSKDYTLCYGEYEAYIKMKNMVSRKFRG